MRSFFWGKKRDQVWWKKPPAPKPDPYEVKPDHMQRIPHIEALLGSVLHYQATLKKQGEETMASLKEILERTKIATKAMEDRFAKQASDLAEALAERDAIRAAYDAFKAEVAEFAEGVDADAADEEKIGAPVVGSTDGIER